MAIENFTVVVMPAFSTACVTTGRRHSRLFPMNRRNLISISPNHIPERIKCIEPDGEMRKINRLPCPFIPFPLCPYGRDRITDSAPWPRKSFSQISFNALMASLLQPGVKILNNSAQTRAASILPP